MFPQNLGINTFVFVIISSAFVSQYCILIFYTNTLCFYAIKFCKLTVSFCICSISFSRYPCFLSSCSRLFSIRSLRLSSHSLRLGFLACALIRIECIICFLVGLQSIIRLIDEVTQFHGRRKDNHSGIHLHAVVSLIGLSKLGVGIGILGYDGKLRIFVAPPVIAKDFTLHLDGISTEAHLVTLYSRKENIILLYINRKRKRDASELITNLYHHIRTGWQRESLRLPIHHLHHWNPQREVITFHYFFHKLIIFVSEIFNSTLSG